MIEPTQLLVNNLLDAFRQLNTYLAVGLGASVSALALDRANFPLSKKKPVEVKGFVPMAPETAKLVLMGITFVAGLMGSYAAESAAGIVNMLQGSPDVLAAACTYSSVATAPIGVRILAALLPVIFVALILLRKDLRGPGAYTTLFLFGGAYGLIGLTLARIACQAP